MIARIITTVLVLLGITAGGYGVVKYEAGKDKVSESPQVVTLSMAWIEIEQGAVFLHGAGQGTPLKTGDSVKAGDTLETGKNTEAVVHFPDGSVLRVDKETSLTLDNFSYTPTDKSLVVEVKLISGRLWSKVVGLATPASHWEVKTSNTVATVRGTAFGIGYKNNKSWILGSEHTVSVAPLDPKTNTPLTNAAVDISEKAYIEIGNKEIELARATTSPVLKSRISTTTNPIENDIWIKKVKVDDEDLNKEIETVKQGAANKDEKTWRTILEQRVTENLYKVAPQKKAEDEQRQDVTGKNNSNNIDEKNSIDAKSVDSQKAKGTEKAQTRDGVANNLLADAQVKTNTAFQCVHDLSLTSDDVFDPIVLPSNVNPCTVNKKAQIDLEEGDKIIFSTYAKDGTSEHTTSLINISKKVTYKVIGDIGTISEDGVFVAKLGTTISENGEAFGGVSATLQQTKGQLTAGGPVIHVRAKAEIVKPEDIGGQ